MTPQLLKSLAYVWSNMDRTTLEDAGIMKPGQIGGSDWKRFNEEAMTFIIKLPEERLAILARLIENELTQ